MCPSSKTPRIVYFDDSLAGSWIDKARWGKPICDYFVRRGFEVKDSANLAAWARARLRLHDAPSTVLVFAQDIVPRQLLESSPNGLFRQYLDAGGRVIWIGDTPLWSQAIPPERTEDGKTKDREEVWGSGLHFSVLGVQPLIAEFSTRTEWDPVIGPLMKSTWYSRRPIAFTVGALWSSKSLAGLTIRPLARTWATLLPTGWNVLLVARWKHAGLRLSGFGASVGGPVGISGSVDVNERLPREMSLKPQSIAAAWQVSFNSAFPGQGFYRLWDCGSEADAPSETLLADMHTLATVPRLPISPPSSFYP